VPVAATTATTTAASFVSGLRRVGIGMLDVLLPPRCLRCGVQVERTGTLCGDCWPQLRLIEVPWCAACGTPFAYDVGEGALCAGCAADRPPYERARAAVIYNDGSKPLILGLKHRDRTDVAPALGLLMARAGAEVLADADLLVPVPLHWTRLFLRRYNQAALLAYAVGRAAGVPVAPDLLVRTRRTQKLGTLGPAARRRMLQGAIAVHGRRRHRAADQNIVLIDDVHTTGATLAACTRALKGAGAARVDVLTFARTTKVTPA
jgi:ComF family protein